MTATTLKANRKMKEEAAVRSLNDELLVLRQRIESDPERYGGVGRLLERAERSALARNLPAARDDLIELKQRMEERDAAFDVAAQQAEQARLAEARGAPTHKSETGVSTRDGWLWLVNKGRFSPARVEAGRRFREKFSKAMDDSMRSCLNDSVGGSGEDANPTSGRSHARFEIEGVKRHMISSAGQAAGAHLFDRLCAVVGRGETARQLAADEGRVDGHKTEAVAMELGFALDLAGVYLGAIRT